MIKKLGNILTYYDSEPTEVLQGLIWTIFGWFAYQKIMVSASLSLASAAGCAVKIKLN